MARKISLLLSLVWPGFGPSWVSSEVQDSVRAAGSVWEELLPRRGSEMRKLADSAVDLGLGSCPQGAVVGQS